MPKPLLPRALKRGDRVAVVTPSGPVRDRKAFDRGLARLRKWGLEPVLGEHAHALALDYLGGEDAQRRADLQRALDDPELRAVFCSRGGYGMTRILSALDFTQLARDPKPILGYSDITALLLGAWTKIGLVSLHGPMLCTSDAMATGDEGLALQHRLLFGDGVPQLPARGSNPRGFCAGTAEGPLLGGNLSLVQTLLGTPHQPSFDGAILFLEDVGEAPYRVDRMLTHLRAAGALERVAGIAFGDFHRENSPLGSDDPATLRVLDERTRDLGVPVAWGFPFGHRPRSWTLPVGVRARLSADRAGARLELLGPATAG